MAVVENASVVEEGAEVASRDVLLEIIVSICSMLWAKVDCYHRQVDAPVVLKGVQQPNKPFALRRGQNIALRQDMSDLIELEQQILAHDFQRTDFACVLLLRQIHLTIATLTDLSENLEVSVSESSATLAQIGTLTA